MEDHRDLHRVSLNLGTPKSPLGEPAIFIKLWRTMKEERDDRWQSRPMASVCLVRPDRAGYVIKPLVSRAQIAPRTAVTGALATARSRKVAQVYINGDLESIPGPGIRD